MTLSLEGIPLANSLLCRLDPRWKLIALAPPLLVIVLIRSLPVSITALGCTWALVLLSRLPLSWYYKRIKLLAAFLALFVITSPLLVAGEGSSLHLGPFTASWAGLTLGIMLLAKALALASLVLVLLGTTQLEAIFKAAHALYVPGLVVQLAMMTYRYVFTFARELARMRVAIRVRGYRNRVRRHSYRTVGHVAGTLLVRGYERAERVGHAMRCRGFDGQFRSLVEFQTTVKDILALCIAGVVSAGLLVWDGYLV